MTAGALSVAVVSASEEVRAGLLELASGVPGMTVSVVLSSVAQLHPPPAGPPLAIVDVSRLHGRSVDGSFWSMLPWRTRVVLVCRPGEPPLLADAVVAGVRAMILPDSSRHELGVAVEAAALDHVYICPRLVGALFEATPDTGVRLSEREIETLRLVADGLSNPMIGQRMGVATMTAVGYIGRVRRKLNAENKKDLTARGIELGYLSPR
ncbi:response regulator transcription factor [Actinoplanes sp. NPDC000266]